MKRNVGHECCSDAYREGQIYSPVILRWIWLCEVFFKRLFLRLSTDNWKKRKVTMVIHDIVLSLNVCFFLFVETQITTQTCSFDREAYQSLKFSLVG